MTDYNIWWCCLHPIEGVVLLQCGFAYSANPVYITKEAFDAMWAALAQPIDGARYNEFIRTYQLTYALVPISEEEVIEAYLFGEPFWAGFFAFGGTPGFICPDPCFILRYSAI